MKNNNNKQTTESVARRPNWFEATKPGQGRANWASVPVQLLLSLNKNGDEGVTTTGLKVFCALATHCLDPNNPGLVGGLINGRFRTPGEKRIAALCGLSVRQVLTGINNLIQHGWIRERWQRNNNTLVLWLAIPDNLDLVDANGRFKDLPEAWTECDYEDSDTEVLAREWGIPVLECRRILRLIRAEDGSVDMDAFMEAVDVYKESKSAKAPVAPAVAPEAVVPAEHVQSPSRASTAPAVPAVDSDADELLDEAPDTPGPLTVTLSDALHDVVRFWDGCGRLYTNDEIRHLGFTYETPWSELYTEFSDDIDLITPVIL